MQRFYHLKNVGQLDNSCATDSQTDEKHELQAVTHWLCISLSQLSNIAICICDEDLFVIAFYQDIHPNWPWSGQGWGKYIYGGVYWHRIASVERGIQKEGIF